MGGNGRRPGFRDRRRDRDRWSSCHPDRRLRGPLPRRRAPGPPLAAQRGGEAFDRGGGRPYVRRCRPGAGRGRGCSPHRRDRGPAAAGSDVRKRLRGNFIAADVEPPRHDPAADHAPPRRRGAELRPGRSWLLVALACVVACSSSNVAAHPTSSPSPLETPTPSPSPPACVQPVARPVAPGVSSADPVLLLASGLNGPDDLLYTDDGTVLVGEHTDGHIARVGGAAGLVRLPQVVPEAEGIAQVGGVTYIADQFHARVVALTDTGVRTVIQLQPVASGENLDGMSSNLKGDGLIVPDSPHGTVLQVSVAGSVISRTGGFARPAGASPDPSAGGYLIADENASAVFELTGGTVKRLAGGLPGVDDAIRTDAGHLLVILPASGRLFDVTAGTNLATGLRNPQGLGFDAAQNVLVTESDNGRLDLVVNTFAITTPPRT